MQKTLLRLHGKFRSIMKLTIELEKSPKRFGTEDLLTHSEIHLIEIIGDNRGLSVTDIAKALGITKGAVSQSLKKMENKGYTTKKTDPENLSRTSVLLTSKGQTAYWSHKDWHEKMDGGFSQYLGELDAEELEIISKFLEKTENFLKRRIASAK